MSVKNSKMMIISQKVRMFREERKFLFVVSEKVLTVISYPVNFTSVENFKRCSGIKGRLKDGEDVKYWTNTVDSVLVSVRNVWSNSRDL